MLVFVAGAGVFGLPLDLTNGPPPQLPPLSRYQAPAFPETLRLTSIADGYATMMLTIDADGRVDDSIAIEASHPAFAQTMHETLGKWRFARAESATVPRREIFQFDFRRTGMIGSLSHRDASKSFFPATPAEHEKPIRTLEWDALARAPERIATAAPIYPADLREQDIAGFALVSFVIDTSGQIRVPAVTASSNRAFADAVLSAVKQWRFAPPSQDGEPIQVRIERSFSFGRASPIQK
jgi:TonB family protein